MLCALTVCQPGPKSWDTAANPAGSTCLSGAQILQGERGQKPVPPFWWLPMLRKEMKQGKRRRSGWIVGEEPWGVGGRNSFQQRTDFPGGREPWGAREGLPHSCCSSIRSPHPASVLMSFLLASSCQPRVQALSAVVSPPPSSLKVSSGSAPGHMLKVRHPPGLALCGSHCLSFFYYLGSAPCPPLIPPIPITSHLIPRRKKVGLLCWSESSRLPAPSEEMTPRLLRLLRPHP